MTAVDADSATARAFVALQYLLPHHLLPRHPPLRPKCPLNL